jgi:pimeloyl-ACP methyl ester carboxylesterase
LDDGARAGASGAFVTLSEGVTHYETAGPDAGPAVVLVHGFSVPAFIWSPTFEALGDAGFRVVRYDLFGRGYSDRPRGRYDLARFDRQLMDLIKALGLGPAVHLMGLSMGGAVAVGFADRHPQRVRSLTLIDPAGFPMEAPWTLKLLRVPVLGEVLISTVGRRVLVSGLVRDFRVPEQLPALARQYLAQMRYRGFMRALLSTIRHGPLQTMAAAYQRVGAQGLPVLLIWGREDTTVPFALSRWVRAAMPKAEFHAIAGAGHVPHMERPELVNGLLIDFLSRMD